MHLILAFSVHCNKSYHVKNKNHFQKYTSSLTANALMYFFISFAVGTIFTVAILHYSYEVKIKTL